MRQLTSLDAQFLAIESKRIYGHVGGLAIYDPSTAPNGEVTAKDISRLFGERLHLMPPFRRRLAEVPLGLDHPYWLEDPDFDLDYHIRETALAPPGDERQLAKQVSLIFARPLDRSRPLWELYLIHGLEGGKIALLTKMHHAMVDGVASAEILTVLFDEQPEGREIAPPDRRRQTERVPSDVEMLARGIAGLPLQPLRALRALPQTIANLDALPVVGSLPVVGRLTHLTTSAVRAVETVLPVLPTPDGGVLGEQPDVSTVPRTRFNGRVSAHRRYSFGSLSLDAIKAVKNAAGVTVNDVVVAICAGGLRQWLLAQNELPDEPLIAMVPMSVRTEEQEGTYGNRVSALFVPIPTNEPDPRRRLELTHDQLKMAKDHHKALPADLLSDATQFIPPALAARASRVALQLGSTQGVQPAFNVTISNVPGPRAPLYCAGALMESNNPVSVVAHGAGLNITCMSYRDHVDFGVIVCRDQMEDAWPLLDALRVALAEFERDLCGTGKGKRTTPLVALPDPAPEDSAVPTA